MHVRLSTALGMPVSTDDPPEMVGILSGVLLHPDTGKVEGFFVEGGVEQHLFLSSIDVRRWTNRVVIRSPDMLAPVEERIRLQPLLQDGRPLLHQPIRTESG